MIKVNEHKSKRIQNIAAVKRAVMATCVRRGITDVNDIRELSLKATSAIRKGSLASLKGWYSHDLHLADEVV